LTDADQNTATNEASNVATGRKGLHKCGDDDKNASDSHTHSTPETIRQRTTAEEASYNGTNRVRGIDGTDGLRVLQ
jgi:hypothetical protein